MILFQGPLAVRITGSISAILPQKPKNSSNLSRPFECRYQMLLGNCEVEGAETTNTPDGIASSHHYIRIYVLRCLIMRISVWISNGLSKVPY